MQVANTVMVPADEYETLKRNAARYLWLRATGHDHEELARRCSIYEGSYDGELDHRIDQELRGL